jgi:hypothetical protein
VEGWEDLEEEEGVESGDGPRHLVHLDVPLLPVEVQRIVAAKEEQEEVEEELDLRRSSMERIPRPDGRRLRLSGAVEWTRGPQRKAPVDYWDLLVSAGNLLAWSLSPQDVDAPSTAVVPLGREPVEVLSSRPARTLASGPVLCPCCTMVTECSAGQVVP